MFQLELGKLLFRDNQAHIKLEIQKKNLLQAEYELNF